MHLVLNYILTSLITHVSIFFVKLILFLFLFFRLRLFWRCLGMVVGRHPFLNLSNEYNSISFITKYDTLNYEPIHRNFRRAVLLDTQNTSINKMRIKFQAFQKNFYLTISEDYSVLHPETEIIVGGIKRNHEGVIPVKGTIENHYFSQVIGTLVDGIFRGTIKFDNIETNGTYYVEHSGYHFQEDPGFHSIIYHDNHININATTESPHFNPSICGWSQPEVAHTMRMTSLNHGIYSQGANNNNYTISRSKRSINIKGTQYVCNLFLQSDTFLWNKVMSLHHVKGQHHLAVKEISSIFTQHVQGAQAIYQNTIFQTFGGRSKRYNGIGFRVDRVRINTTEDCEAPLKNTNPFCSPNIDVTNFLNLNSYMKHDDFCLAYIFTYRDFNGGTLGLAWVAEPGGSGGVCEKNRLMQEAGWNVQKSLNTGIVTLLNYGSYVALKVSQLTFAHEMGHNFGSKHDDDHKDHRECLPSFDDPKGNYIMFASATSGEKENNNKFSGCSKDSIARLLDRVTSSSSNCFLNQEGSFCGNKLTEDGEECDCGYSQKDCQDQCCNPKLSSASCKLNHSVTIFNQVKRVRCSPNAGECCNKDCQFEPGTRKCRYKGECHKAAFCTGNDTKCPMSEKVPDLTTCQDNTRVCKNGECVGSICEKVPGWQECSIVRNDDVTPEMMCFVACKDSVINSPCISTYDLQKDKKLQDTYPALMNALMSDKKAIQLKAGAPCDNYHGYCDVFLRCRSVEADGPLARIKNMIFSFLMLNKIRRWTTQFWWAVMLMCIGAIVFVGIFLKICSKSTPSINPRSRKRPKVNNHRIQHRESRHRSDVVANGGINQPTAPAARLDRTSAQTRSQSSNAPTRSSRNRDRPISMFQSNSNQPEADSRPLSMNFELNVEMRGLANHNPLPSYPPPAYESPIVMPRQHGHGRGKKGHRHALNQQASRYHECLS